MRRQKWAQSKAPTKLSVMFGENDTTWSSLIVDQQTAPPAIPADTFNQWIRGRRVFVSSVIDDEMSPARGAVREYLLSRGADAVMWESLAPADARPEDAYLVGVDQSELFVLLLGTRYGRSDATGYAPTHKEGNRAVERRIPRLIFERNVPTSERDGRLNDWVQSLYAEVSGARYSSPTDLVAQLDARLREFASMADAYWIKLGQVVFTGTVRRRTTQGQTEFIVQATVRDARVRRALAELGSMPSRIRADRLTWNAETHPVSVDAVESETIGVSADKVIVRCLAAKDYYGSRAGLLMSIGTSGGRSIGPAAQAEQWAKRSLFCEERNERDQWRSSSDMLDSMTAPQGLTLPQVLATEKATGWLAEGLSRLYLVERLDAKYGGHLLKLTVGPATSTGVRINAELQVGDEPPVSILGTAPIVR